MNLIVLVIDTSTYFLSFVEKVLVTHETVKKVS